MLRTTINFIRVARKESRVISIRKQPPIHMLFESSLGRLSPSTYDLPLFFPRSTGPHEENVKFHWLKQLSIY